MKISRRSAVKAILPGAILATALTGRAKAAADQPHMQEALDSLKEAQRHLEQATSDKGGHRARAMTHVRQAINEVEKGIKFDRRH